MQDLLIHWCSVMFRLFRFFVCFTFKASLFDFKFGTQAFISILIIFASLCRQTLLPVPRQPVEVHSLRHLGQGLGADVHPRGGVESMGHGLRPTQSHQSLQPRARCGRGLHVQAPLRHDHVPAMRLFHRLQLFVRLRLPFPRAQPGVRACSGIPGQNQGEFL